MNSLKGHLLVATPRLLDPNFFRTVLLMLQHTEEGAVGLVLNRPTEVTIAEVSEQVFEERIDWQKPLLLGGPVPGPLMVLHSIEGLADDEVLPGVRSTADSSKIRALLDQRPEPSLVIANYAGWGPGQLEGEIEEDSWLSLPARVEHVFWASDADLWSTVVKQIQAAHLTDLLGLRDVPADPSVN